MKWLFLIYGINLETLKQEAWQILTTAEAVKDELVMGLCRCVQWKSSVRFMVDSGVSRFVEFGPAGVLSGLIRRIERGVQAMTVSDPASIQKLGTGVG